MLKKGNGCAGDAKKRTAAASGDVFTENRVQELVKSKKPDYIIPAWQTIIHNIEPQV